MQNREDMTLSLAPTNYAKAFLNNYSIVIMCEFSSLKWDPTGDSGLLQHMLQ